MSRRKQSQNKVQQQVQPEKTKSDIVEELAQLEEVKEKVDSVGDDVSKFVKQLQDIDTTNSASAHHEADGILINALTELGYKDLVDAWREVSQKSGGFEYV
jgi:hypothetical protein